MRTQMMIMLIVSVIVLLALGLFIGTGVWVGWVIATLVAVLGTALLAGWYLWLIKPWHMRWGATDAELERTMPGDDLILGAGSATRAISIAAPPEAIWPWLVQLGYGKAGWYSYDWIDNDFKESARRVLPEFQSLAVGDKILMMPTMGFEVRSIVEHEAIVSVLEDGSTSWCLALYPEGDQKTRLVSRWRPKFEKTPATFLLTVLSEPGTFIMEQKMLRTIRDRVQVA